MSSTLDSDRITRYLLSLPERVVRSGSAVAAGLLRELGDVTLPGAVRRTRLYKTMVEGTLRFLIEHVGGMENAFPGEEKLAGNFLVRRTAGDGLDFIGLATLHASPVWVMASLADITGSGRQLINEISDALKRDGLLDANTEFSSIDQMLDGLENTAERLAFAARMPPLDVKSLRSEWRALQTAMAKVPPKEIPGIEQITAVWRSIQHEAETQERSVFEVSTAMALSAVASLPRNLVWLSLCAGVAAQRTGELFAGAILEHYSQTLDEIHREGYLRYWGVQMRPYLVAAARQFSWDKISTTEKLLGAAPARVVLVHGGPGASGGMEAVAEALQPQWSAIAPVQTAMSVEAQVAELREAIATLAEPPVTLVGHSWGAWLALLTAAEAPELAAKLILVAAPAFDERYVAAMRERRLARLSEDERREFLALMDSPGERLARLGELAAKADSVDEEPDTAPHKANGEIYARVWPQAAELRRTGELLRRAAMVQCPLVVIHGDSDPTPVESVVEPLRRAGIAPRVHVLERCGHTPWRERQARAEFYRILNIELSASR